MYRNKIQLKIILSLYLSRVEENQIIKYWKKEYDFQVHHTIWGVRLLRSLNAYCVKSVGGDIPY